MNERDYLHLKKQFADDYAKKVEALELIWQESSGGKKPPKEQVEGNVTSGARGYLATALEDFYKSWGAKEFSAKNFEDWLRRERNMHAHRTTVTHKLRRLVNDGALGLAARGSGKRGSVYFWIEAKRLADKPLDGSATEQPVTDEDVQAFKAMLLDRQAPIEEVRRVLSEEYGVEKIIQLSRQKFEELLTRFAQEAELPDPAAGS